MLISSRMYHKFRISIPGAVLTRFLGSSANFAKNETHTQSNVSIPESNSIGQPTHATHPYLLSPEEVTPLIQRQEYQDRRNKFIENIRWFSSKQNTDIKRYLAIIPSATKKYMSDKIPYFFRQNSDFLYLTGCQEPDSCLILLADTSSIKYSSVLFVQGKDPHTELWDGPRTAPESATNYFGVDQSLPMNELKNYLQSYWTSNKKTSLWYDFVTPPQESLHQIISSCLDRQNYKMWESPKMFIHQQRLIKSPAEIELMHRTCKIASEAIVRTVEKSKPGINESEIFATVDYECRIMGAEYLAYPPVVAGGKRANIIHYITNNQIVDNGDMVLMDAGCEYHGYTSDITRTWPINGKFNEAQRELYEIILEVQQEMIELCKNFPSLDSLFDSMCLSLGGKLQEIGIISKGLPENNLIRAAYQFCPHHVSHYLGLDVHDTPSISRNIPIKPGMVVTIEPGIYINEQNKRVPEKYRGLGIRIEDDVLISENGPIVLTKSCPKSVSDIERIASKYLSLPTGES